jgi:hypothetical protein
VILFTPFGASILSSNFALVEARETLGVGRPEASGAVAPFAGSNPGWTNVTPAYGPSATTGAAMTFVPELTASLLFGGNQTWLYAADRNNWTRVNSGTATPPRRMDAAVAYAANLHKVVLFGGLDRSNPLLCPRNDTWIFDPPARTWTNLTPPHSPSARRAHAMAYDGKTGMIVLFGGHQVRCGVGVPESTGPRLSDTWLYDPTANTWTNVTYPGGPQPRSGAGLAYVPELSASLLFGGQIRELYQREPVLADTWIFDSFSYRWTELLPFNPPSARSGLGMAYVANAHVALAYGGCDPSGCSRDTWWYDPAMRQWVERSSSVGPDFAPGAAFSSDPTGVVVAIGRSATWQYRPGSVPTLAARPWATGVSEQTPETIAFHAAVTGGVPPYTYLWSFGDQAKSTESDPVHPYTVGGVYHVSLRVRDASGNSTVASFDHAVFPRVALSGGISPPLVGGMALILGVAALWGWFRWQRRPHPPKP